MKLKLTVEYEGTLFSGWQRQGSGEEFPFANQHEESEGPDGCSDQDTPERCLPRTIQGELERALGVVLRSHAKRQGTPPPPTPFVNGSGRTDAGVHARGQVASFDWPAGFEIEPERLRASLDAITPRGISVVGLEQVPDEFDARFSPHIKCYAYHLLLRRSQTSLFWNRAWVVSPSINLASMARAARSFVGQHDFQSFRDGGCNAASTVRTLLTSEVTRISSEGVVFTVHGTGFLKQMIRIMIGTLVEIGLGRRAADDIPRILAAKNRVAAGQTAPPYGLSLEWVKYLERPYFKSESTPGD